MWLYEGTEVNEIAPFVGFVYKITNLTNGRMYIGKKLYIIHYRHFAKTGPDWFRKYCIDDYKGVYPFKSFAKSISREMNKEGYFNTVEVFDHDKEYVDCLYRPVTK
jgi:hypothetical protein